MFLVFVFLHKNIVVFCVHIYSGICSDLILFVCRQEMCSSAQLFSTAAERFHITRLTKSMLCYLLLILGRPKTLRTRLDICCHPI